MIAVHRKNRKWLKTRDRRQLRRYKRRWKHRASPCLYEALSSTASRIGTNLYERLGETVSSARCEASLRILPGRDRRTKRKVSCVPPCSCRSLAAHWHTCWCVGRPGWLGARLP